MKFNLEKPLANNIHGYTDGRVNVLLAEEPAPRVITGSLLLSATHFQEGWTEKSISQLQADDFTQILAMQPELVLLGTGQHLQFPDMAVLQPFYQAAIGVEVMDTAAACRTYNILVAEGRGVLAALLLT